jgi:starvation-inducible DNA-binding protein
MAEENITIKRLNELLGSHFTVMTHAWGCHWNVTGMGFKAAHDFLKDLYEAEQERVDATAERVRALGGVAPDSIEEMERRTLISTIGSSANNHDMKSVWNNLAHLWSNTINIIVDVHRATPEDDIATRSFLENMTEEMQKELWMIKANLE